MSGTGSVLVDTNIVVAHFRGDPGLISHLEKATGLYVPWVVLGELYFGAQRARRAKDAIAQIRDFLGIAVLLLPDERTAEHYGRVKAELARAGTLIPENDIWIAALAREYKLPLATRDKHFISVPDVRTLAW